MSATISLLCRIARLTVRGSLTVVPLSLLTVALAPVITIVDSGSLSIGVAVASAAQLTSTWTDNAGGTANFKVERKTGTAGTYTQIGTTATGVTSYVDTTVAAGTTYCYRVMASNAYGDSGYSNEACGQAAGGAYDVTVAKAGTGSGTVASSPTGISCGTDCYESFVPGTVVTLTPTAATGSVFSGWSGGGCTGTSQCVMTGNAPVRITATFSSAPQSSPPSSTSSYTLRATKSGTGWGTVVSSPAGIQCGSDCTESVAAGATVTLTAAPGKGSRFTGWIGATCSGTGTCTVKVSGSTTVNAEFTRKTTTTYTLTVTKAGTGVGTVISTPTGIDCGTACSASYPSGRVVTLTPTAASGSTFTGWTGDSACGSSVTMTSSLSCTANFASSGVGTPPPPPPSTGCPCKIWSTSTTPTTLVDPDTNAVELGVKFRADSDGYITAIRFYKSSANTGTHTGHLWTSTGQLLAFVTFSGETPSGWQQANLSTPVPISANTVYVASYHTGVGQYSVDEGYFASTTVDNPPLHAVSDAAGGNGVYRYGPGGFPNQTYHASNYWVDVVFTPR